MSEIIGHGAIIRDLKRLAEYDKLSHGYIFFGPAMVGKRTVAQSFVNFLETGNFEEPLAVSGVEPKVLQDGLLIKPDEKGTLGIDAVRTLKNFLWQKPNVSEKRTAIIDGGEFLTAEAQNALLKITEEPPQSALLILITSDIDALLPTISSRLQKIYFSAVDSKSLTNWLADDLGIAKKAAEDLSKKSFGKPGLAAAFLRDEEFQTLLKSAETLLKSSSEKRRDFLKKLMEDELFDLAKLLDAMILCISAEGLDEKKKLERWHKFLELRHEVAYFNLNPKLQLENLLT